MTISCRFLTVNVNSSGSRKTSAPTDLDFGVSPAHTHTQAGGGKEGGNKDSQPQPRRARAQSKTRNKAKPTSSDAIEAGQQREGTNTLLGGGERGPGGWEGAQKRGRKRDGPSYTPVSRAAPEEGEGEARTDENITWPHGYFSLVGTSPKA